MLPRHAAVGGLVHAVADREVRPDDASAAADVDDIGIRRCNGDCADRSGGLRVENRQPVRAVVRRTPHATVVETDVKHIRLAGHTGERARTTAAHRTDMAPMHAGCDVRLLRCDECRCQRGGGECGERKATERVMHVDRTSWRCEQYGVTAYGAEEDAVRLRARQQKTRHTIAVCRAFRPADTSRGVSSRRGAAPVCRWS